MNRLLLAGTLVVCSAAAAVGQDTTGAEQGVRVGIAYRPGTLPGMVVLPGVEPVDRFRRIIERDLDYSDLFEMIPLPGFEASTADDSAAATGPVVLNYALYRALGAEFAIQFAGTPTAPMMVVHRASTADLLRAFALDTAAIARDDRFYAHRLADDIVRLTVRATGIASTRFAFVRDGEVWLVDADGARERRLTRDGRSTLSPIWSPDGRSLTYSAQDDGPWRLFQLDLAGQGAARLVFGTGSGLNFAPSYSPDGRELVFSRATDGATHVFAVNLRDNCCLRRLTVGEFSDNLNPTFSPDGSRIAFVSTRAGVPQVYVMSADGSDQRLFAPFDYGVTGASHAPAWSPDGQRLAFHRSVAGTFQVFVMDVRSEEVRQLTSTGVNTDPTWAADSRHVAFRSTRTGTGQVWVMDIETGRVRQVTRQGGVRLPAWSPLLSASTSSFP